MFGGPNVERILIGVIVVASSVFLIRNQVFVSESQFLRGMIPHHSMAVFMSKKLSQKTNRIPDFLQQIVGTQTDEIDFMKDKLRMP